MFYRDTGDSFSDWCFFHCFPPKLEKPQQQCQIPRQLQMCNVLAAASLIFKFLLSSEPEKCTLNNRGWVSHERQRSCTWDSRRFIELDRREQKYNVYTHKKTCHLISVSVDFVFKRNSFITPMVWKLWRLFNLDDTPQMVIALNWPYISRIVLDFFLILRTFVFRTIKLISCSECGFYFWKKK